MNRPSRTRTATTVPPSPAESAPAQDRYDPVQPTQLEPMAVFGWD